MTRCMLLVLGSVFLSDPVVARVRKMSARWGLGLDHARSAGGQTYFAVPRDGTANERVFRLPLC
ncbi:hypothetical protein HMPREF9337_00103 [Cutibacterium acnes HL096PA3]|uniref:Uncharacterized protein n=2 Tax=Cutibacterium acnes TaxID=1747 RepID=Q6A5G7_CUTAK|nr:hypothetical protein PPA2290 [Cutibacterium acnes KPA171202]EFS64509.1 hypothetical protein HMPREF9611_00416 [Cutibacterium acnes HL063PA1]EFS99826.1 hypothetical protein HMPREF9609_01559 [Cutibacterium acnes HL027PA1]EFT52034.1 hypothetical protein HMPREF9569_02449 [Cutibacterium acnes HL078PA1]EGE75763.1 hypothetical protein HMPREF9337_00103 [Cutibacterium acnes HL096PA3]EGF01757.1 hypothetical protein HMPREF9581_00352 [Cutibacterium acnes HL087PA3]EGF71262.1 hypothetical protein HMPREF9